GGFSPIVQDNFLPHLTTSQKTAPNFLWCGQSQIFFPKYPTLSEAQQRYAATDAWICIKIFNLLDAKGFVY
ncbi:MAG: hypothetical protein RIA69_11820, partial [Cyclobacteriaceae bacterium]